MENQRLISVRFTKRRLIIFAAYIGCVLLLFEGAARIAFVLLGDADHPVVADELSWRRAWVRRHQTTGVQVYYSFDLYDPTKGWRAKPDLDRVKVWGDKVLSTNSKGLRGRTENSYVRNDPRQRILLLGDSFTFGDKVSDDETYAHQLQQLLPDAEVINLGVHGYGHDQMLIVLREEGLAYQPDIVLLGFIANDMNRNLLSFRDYAKPRFRLEDGRLRLTGVPIPSPNEILEWDWMRPRMLDALSFIRYRAWGPSTRYLRERETIAAALLNEIAKVSDSAHAIPIFAYLPYGKDILAPNDGVAAERFLLSFCETHSLAKCFSTRPYFAARVREGVAFKKRGHWRPAGHRTAAEAIAAYLTEEGYVNSRPAASPRAGRAAEASPRAGLGLTARGGLGQKGP